MSLKKDTDIDLAFTKLQGDLYGHIGGGETGHSKASTESTGFLEADDWRHFMGGSGDILYDEYSTKDIDKQTVGRRLMSSIKNPPRNKGGNYEVFQTMDRRHTRDEPNMETQSWSQFLRQYYTGNLYIRARSTDGKIAYNPIDWRQIYGEVLLWEGSVSSNGKLLLKDYCKKFERFLFVFEDGESNLIDVAWGDTANGIVARTDFFTTTTRVGSTHLYTTQVKGGFLYSNPDETYISIYSYQQAGIPYASTGGSLVDNTGKKLIKVYGLS